MSPNTFTGEVLLSGIGGSTSHGLSTELSDIDTHGVFAAPTLDVAGLFWNSAAETYTTASPQGDDETYHEVAKAIKQFFKANPAFLELLWLDEYVVKNSDGQMLIDIRDTFLSSKAVYHSYTGVVRASIHRFTEKGDSKAARHALRLIDQGIHLYTTGEMIVRVDDPQKYLDIQSMPSGQALDLITTEYKRWDDVDASALPEYPDKSKAIEALAEIRRNYL